jgi:hypothetical protein
MKKTYRYATNEDGSRELSFTWQFLDGSEGERFVKLDNVNALIFMVDMLDRLGYTHVR